MNQTGNAFHCDMCGRNLPTGGNGCGTGYGKDADDNVICYRCCGILDLDEMAAAKPGERVTFYLTFHRAGDPPHMRLHPYPGRPSWIVGQGYISNWPGSFRFEVKNIKVSWHNIARVRYDTWFQDHTGAWWWGVQYGDQTQIIHCMKLKHAVV